VRSKVASRGRISKDPYVSCIASFPGKYPGAYRELVRQTESASVACVWLPDARAGLGQHAPDREAEDGRCYCRRIYGERDFRQFGYVIRVTDKYTEVHRERAREQAQATSAVVVDDKMSEEEYAQRLQIAERNWEASGRVAAWGCKWFQLWQHNVELAVARSQSLVVYYYRGEKGKGKTKWEDLADPATELWNGAGLGGSQKVEVAYLDRMIAQYGPVWKYKELDVSSCWAAGRGTTRSRATGRYTTTDGRPSRASAASRASRNSTASTVAPMDSEEDGGARPAWSVPADGAQAPPSDNGEDEDEYSDVDSMYTDFSDAAEMLISPMKWPIFILAQILVVWPLWIYFKVNGGGFVAGLDSLYPAKTDLRINVDCQDLREEWWRWLSYQFTHAGVTHIGFNTFMLLFLGVPLEGFHGHLHFAFMFNFGVFGGACCFLVTDPHGPSLVGMSGGCYSLLGMHMADILMNFAEKEKPRRKLFILLAIAVVDLVNVTMSSDSGQAASPSHWAHLGGYVFGLLVGVVVGRNVVQKQNEKYIWLASLLLGIALVAFSLAWALSWPPRSLLEAVPWCWGRQVSNASAFGNNNFHCVRCASLDCISRWTSTSCDTCVMGVSISACESTGGWEVTG